jgi:hypothetical protein
VADATRGAQLGSERRLPVGSRPDKVEPPARAEDTGAEAGHEVSALVFEGHRWHRVKTSSVRRATNASRSADSHALTNLATIASSECEPGAGRGSRWTVGGRRCCRPGARPFEGAVDRFDGRVQHVGHLVRVESENVAQDEDSELAGRQELKGGHEGERDGFGLLVAGLRAERHVDLTLRGGRREMARAITTSLSRVGSGGSTLGTSHSLADRRPASDAR